MAQIEKITTKEALVAEIRKLSAEQQILASVIMGPGRFLEETVESMGGPIKFTRQLISRNPEENEKAIATMLATLERLAALADTDKLQQIGNELVAKAKNAVQEGNAYDISMLTIAAVAEFSPFKGRLLSKVDDLPHDAGTLHKTIDAPNLRPVLDPSTIAYGKQYDLDIMHSRENRSRLVNRIWEDHVLIITNDLNDYEHMVGVDPADFRNLVNDMIQPRLTDKVDDFNAQVKQLDDIQEKLSEAKKNVYYESYQDKVQDDYFDYEDYSSAEGAREYAEQDVKNDFSKLKGDIYAERNNVINDQLGEDARQARVDEYLQQQNQSQPVASPDGP